MLSITYVESKGNLRLDDLHRLAPLLAARGLSLQLGVMETSSGSSPAPTEQEQQPNEQLPAEQEQQDRLAGLLSLLDVSFIAQPEPIARVLSASYFPQLAEVKFIQCEAVTDAVLAKLAMVSDGQC